MARRRPAAVALTMRWAAPVAILAALLAACSDPAPAGDGERVTLDSLTGAQVCELVDRATIDKAFGVAISASLPGNTGSGDERTASCMHTPQAPAGQDVDDMFTLSTFVSAAEGGSVTAALAGHFEDMHGKPVDYQRVDGLGDGAGYADKSKHVRLGEDQLAAVLDVDGKLVEVVLTVEPKGTAQQLKPVAAELLNGLEAKLG